MPKHLLISLILKWEEHAGLITMFNRYGHCQSYPRTLELETAMTKQVKEQGGLIPSNISTTGNNVCHMCWDNFSINEETPSGAGTTHTTHDIVI